MEMNYNTFVWCIFSYSHDFKHPLWFSVNHGSETAQQFPQQNRNSYRIACLTVRACGFSTNHIVHGVFS